MPELPEVQTTVDGINKTVQGLQIVDMWTSYNSPYYKNKKEIKNPAFFTVFRSQVINQKIIKAERRAKNILIHITRDNTVLIHMKMTGHVLYGTYEISKDKKDIKDPWKPKDKHTPLGDPFNRHIRLVFSLSNGKHLVLSDMRRFAKVTLIKTGELLHSSHISHIGPEPLDKKCTLDVFKKQILRKPKGKIKTVLMDQTVIAGVGNIYSDEALWLSNIHPERKVSSLSTHETALLFNSIKKVLKRGIDFGGDSMSDYRNIYGERGQFQSKHNVYRKTGTTCVKKECGGKICRKVVGGRSAHFCNIHQK